MQYLIRGVESIVRVFGEGCYVFRILLGLNTFADHGLNFGDDNTNLRTYEYSSGMFGFYSSEASF